MTHNPEFPLQREDVRDWFVDAIISIVMLMLAIDGWFSYLGR